MISLIRPVIFKEVSTFTVSGEQPQFVHQCVRFVDEYVPVFHPKKHLETEANVCYKLWKKFLEISATCISDKLERKGEKDYIDTFLTQISTAFERKYGRKFYFSSGEISNFILPKFSVFCQEEMTLLTLLTQVTNICQNILEQVGIFNDFSRSEQVVSKWNDFAKFQQEGSMTKSRRSSYDILSRNLKWLSLIVQVVMMGVEFQYINGSCSSQGFEGLLPVLLLTEASVRKSHWGCLLVLF